MTVTPERTIDSVLPAWMRQYAEQRPSPRGPLAGVRVLDFTWYWAGPYGTMLLAFLGAEVIKVESMKKIDGMRRPDSFVVFSTPKGHTMEQRQDVPYDQAIEQQVTYQDMSLGKLSVKLDLSQPKAREIARRLVAKSDVVAENFRPGVMDKLELGYQRLREVKPDIIMLATSAMGSTGPRHNDLGFAVIFNALSGLAHLTGHPEAPPTDIRDGTDLRASLSSAFAVLAALVHRQRTGQGQYIDVASVEAVSCLVGEELMHYSMNGEVRNRKGNRDDILAPHNLYRCQGDDAWVAIVVGSDQEWRAVCAAIGQPGLASDARYADAYKRWANQLELDAILATWALERTAHEASALLQAAGVAATPLNNAPDLLNDPHLRAREAFVHVNHPLLPERDVMGVPFKLSGTPVGVPGPAPMLGQHTPYVLTNLLGMSEDEVLTLAQEGVLG
jgi:benzylsuccinate CoA-transferase BbsF subunit